MRLWLAFLFAVAAPTAGCNKPSDEACRKAILNIQRLRAIEAPEDAGAVEAEVRKCRANSRRETIDCIAAAQTAEQLDACQQRR